MVKITLIILTFFYSFDNPLETANNYTKQLNDTIYDELIYISIKNQKLFHIKEKKIIKIYSISSSEKGVGNKINSNKTPLGLHSVKEKHGHATPLYGKMVGRVFNGEIVKVYNNKQRSKTDDITTRILWLTGEEENYNKNRDVDSYNRYIYIHGTSEEGRIGIPSSHGCIRMKNIEVLELFNKIKVGTKVLILDN
ncbi:MAG: hypothetical protein CMD04_04760 [Flavobacteriales bacterium]|nr:hypothetical protein [Flavobacteriales bacterium]